MNFQQSKSPLGITKAWPSGSGSLLRSDISIFAGNLARGVNQDCCLLKYPCQFVACQHTRYLSNGVVECWSVGALERWVQKVEKDLILFFHHLFPISKHGSYFPITPPKKTGIFDNTPLLRIRVAASFGKEWLTDVFQQP